MRLSAGPIHSIAGFMSAPAMLRYPRVWAFIDAFVPADPLLELLQGPTGVRRQTEFFP
jgi:hypothetical protein